MQPCAGLPAELKEGGDERGTAVTTGACGGVVIGGGSLKKKVYRGKNEVGVLKVEYLIECYLRYNTMLVVNKG